MASVSCRTSAESPSSNRRASINARDQGLLTLWHAWLHAHQGIVRLRYPSYVTQSRTKSEHGTLGRFETVTGLTGSGPDLISRARWHSFILSANTQPNRPDRSKT